jgi:hypothetical protein
MRRRVRRRLGRAVQGAKTEAMAKARMVGAL